MKIFKSIFYFCTIFFVVSCSVAETNSDNLIIATFNVEWLGDGIDDTKQRTQEDYARIADVILATKADIIGLQEVENEVAINNILQFLPDYDYKIANDDYRQRNAVLFKKNDISIINTNTFTDLIVEQNRTRPGLLINAKKGNFDFNLLVVHFKSTSRFDSTDELRNQSFSIRYKQASVLKNWLQNSIQNDKEKDFIVVGDFNDNPNNKKPRGNLDELINFFEMEFLSANLTSCKNAKWNVIDHIVVSKSAKSRYLENSIYLFDTYSAYKSEEVKQISDHCPVVATFDIKKEDND